MSYDLAYAMEEAMSSMALSLIMNAGSSLMSIAIYIFTSLSLYTIAKRRDIRRPWMAWVPVANAWLLGSIADQYRYVAKGETKNKRKVLLVLRIISAVLVTVFFAVLFAMIFKLVMEVTTFSMDEEELVMSVMGSLGGMVAMFLPFCAVSIAYAIIYYMALYDIYESCDPGNKVLYLVIGIFVGIAQAVFLFICRNKDGGMPPRKGIPQAPQYGGNYQQQGQPYQQYGGQYQQQGQPYQQYGGQQYGQQYQQYGGGYQQPAQPYQQSQPYQQPAQPIVGTENLNSPDPNAPYKSPYGDFPDPYGPQHPEQL